MESCVVYLGYLETKKKKNTYTNLSTVQFQMYNVRFQIVTDKRVQSNRENRSIHSAILTLHQGQSFSRSKNKLIFKPIFEKISLSFFLSLTPSPSLSPPPSLSPLPSLSLLTLYLTSIYLNPNPLSHPTPLSLSHPSYSFSRQILSLTKKGCFTITLL